MKKAYLILEDGTVFEGKSVGSEKEIISEIVFNTGVVGRRVQNVIVAKIQRNVAYAFDSRQMLTAFVGEIDTVSAL